MQAVRVKLHCEMNHGGADLVGHGAAGRVKAAGGEEPLRAGIGATGPERDPSAANAVGVIERGVQ